MKQYVVAENVTCRIEEPEGALLYHRDTENLQIINMTGLLIWQALQKQRTVDGIVENLLELGMDVDRNTLTEDVSDFLENMVINGLVTIREDAEGNE